MKCYFFSGLTINTVLSMLIYGGLFFFDVPVICIFNKEPAVNCFAGMKLNSIDEARTEMRRRVGETEYYFAIALKNTGKVRKYGYDRRQYPAGRCTECR